MAEKRESSRSTSQHELSLSHTDILDLMNDGDVGLSPEDDEQLYLFIRTASGSEINLSLRQLYAGDQMVFRFYRVAATSETEELTDVDIS